MRLPAAASLLAIVLFAVLVDPAAGQTSVPDGAAGEPEIDRRWLERLPKLDRALLEELVGYAPPDFTDDLRWPVSSALTWPTLRGRVVVLQSWTVRKPQVPRRLENAIADVAPNDVQAVLLHTPEGTDLLERFLERKPIGRPIVVDPKGAFCDALGIYKRPVNVVVDRNGKVRYVGLTWPGVRAAVEHLVQEPFDDTRVPEPRPTEPARATMAFPAFLDPVENATDVRGRRGPDLWVNQWINGRPDVRGKVTIVGFWVSELEQCVRQIPRLNQLADRFRGDVVMIGISDESAGELRQFLVSHDMRYHVGSDVSTSVGNYRSTRMMKAVGTRTWPHCLVLSSDWIVRWQGHPDGLTADTVDQIVQADRAARGLDRGTDETRRRWTR